jgi:plastocyanin
VRLIVATLVAVTACGSSSATVDAPASGDGSTSTVHAVTCPATPAGTVTTSDLTTSYAPKDTTITHGQIVKFVMSLDHDLVPNGGTADPGLNVGFNETKCLQFTQPGTFPFRCSTHGFVGSVIVN